MSLINEALKRAREEAARRQAAEKGLPLPSHGLVRERGRWLNLTVVVLAGALLVSLVLLVNLSSKLPEGAGAGESAEPSSQTVREPVETAITEPVSSATEVLEAEPEEVVARPVPTPPAGPTAAAGTVEEAPPAQPRPDPVERAESDASVGITEQGASAPGTRLSDQPREYTGQARLSGGQLVDLEGIAWSEAEPFALLNGQVVGVGEFIRSYKVLEIHQDRVLLKDGEETVLLRLQ